MTFHNFTIKIPVSMIHTGKLARQYQLSVDVTAWEPIATQPFGQKVHYDIDKITLHKKRSKRPPRTLPQIPDALSDRFLRPLVEDAHDALN